MPQLTMTVTPQLTNVVIDPNGPRLILQGTYTESGETRPVRSFSEDVTDSLTPTQLGYIQAIANRAQQWLDNRTVQ